MGTKNYMNFFMRKSVFKRRMFFIFSDILLISAAMCLAFWLRFDGKIPGEYSKTIYIFILLVLLCKLFFMFLYNLYDISWRYVGLNELIKMFKAISIGSLSFGMVLYLLRIIEPFSTTPFPRSILLLDYILSLIMIGSFRVAKRIVLEGFGGTLKLKDSMKKTLIVGAGNAGEQIVRDMVRNKESKNIPVGFIDDDPAKKGIMMHGVRVMGNRDDIPEVIKNYAIDDVLIALPSLNSTSIRELVTIIRETGKIEKIKILPGLNDLINGNVSLADIQEVKVADLLGRAAVEVDLNYIEFFIQNKVVLVTGAGGSIGSELVKSVCQFNPKCIIALEIDETELFYLANQLKNSKPKITPIIGDIRDEIKMQDVFERFSPEIVFHTAAYKHVAMVEDHPGEAVKTNIQGTKILAEQSLKNQVEKFIFISTDKAINPTSIMGATKRSCEELLKALNRENQTKFISVRFGNVLGSRGSVIPIFEEQIEMGGPVTLTHPEMKRYFMITSEAVLLVLEAAAVGKGGEVFVLDMGKPIKIIDLAREMIRLSGYEPDVDIPIVITRVEPGEKLFEEILGAEEGTEPTQYDKLYLVKELAGGSFNSGLREQIDNLIKISYANNGKDEIKSLLKKIVPTYKPYVEANLT